MPINSYAKSYNKRGEIVFVMKKYLSELYKRKDLIMYLVTSGLKAQHRNSFLGYLWWLLDPLLGMFIYYFLLVVIFRTPGGADYGIFLVTGMIVWRWLDSTVSSASKSIVGQAGIITQVYLPKSIFPVGVVLTQLINFGFGLLVIAIFCIFFKIIPGIQLLWLPFIMMMQLFFMLAIIFPLAFVCVFIRDVDNIIGHLMRIWFFTSPVIWSKNRIPQKLQWLLDINPMTYFLGSYRNVLVHNSRPDFIPLLCIGTTSAMAAILMLYYYSRYEHKIIKVL